MSHGDEEDPSFYDITRIDTNEYWIGGKNGSLISIDTNERMTPVQYPGTGAHILKIASFSNDKVIMAADQGTLYLHDRTSGAWQVIKVPGYENRTFYSLQIIDSATAFIAGGASSVSFGKIGIPHGFILMTRDGGETWEEVYRHSLFMIWELNYNTEEHRLYASLYSPLGSRILYTSVETR